MLFWYVHIDFLNNSPYNIQETYVSSLFRKESTMFIQATISCECGCFFESEFQTSEHEKCPICPQCGKAMDFESWKHLRSIMADFNDFNTNMLKWHSDRNEPLM